MLKKESTAVVKGPAKCDADIDTLIPVGSSLRHWSQLLVKLAHSQVRKRQAVAAENFPEASRLKRQEAELEARVLDAAIAVNSSASRAEEVSCVEVAKRSAIEAENFIEAGRMKKRLRCLEELAPLSSSEREQRAREGAVALVPQLVASVEDASEVLSCLQANALSLPSGKGTPAKGEVEPITKCELEPTRAHTLLPQPVSEVVTASAPTQVKIKAEEASTLVETCCVPEKTVDELLRMSNQDLWQHAWNVTWLEADAEGAADNEAQVREDAQKVWKAWLLERDRCGLLRARVEGQKGAESILLRGTTQKAAGKAPSTLGGNLAPSGPVVAATSPRASVAGGGSVVSQCPPGLTDTLLRAQQANWRKNPSVKLEWERLTEAAAKRQTSVDEAPKGSRDICAILKRRCPADQPLKFERLLAVAPKGTSVRQLVQAMACEPQEFRQSWVGDEFCIRPGNSRCIDWLPVQATKIPPGFRADAVLPEEMLIAAKEVFEERVKPHVAPMEEPLLQFLVSHAGLELDTPILFRDLVSRCPPGTTPLELIRMMSKARDTFRQSSDGASFCLKPRARCKDFGPVNPYSNPSKLLGEVAQPKIVPTTCARAKAKEEQSDGEY